MRFEAPLIKASLIKRYKRFLVDATLETGEVVTAHCPNTGSMMGLLEEGADVWLSPAADPNRKLKYTLEMIQTPDSLVGVHTGRPNKLVKDAIENGQLDEHFADRASLKAEQKYGENSRIDLLIEEKKPSEGGRKCFIEIKNVTLRQQDKALFPDSVTARGAKHLAELTAEVEKGNRAVMFYLVQRQDCKTFSPAADIDPHYTRELAKAVAAGVEVLAYTCHLDPEIGIELSAPLTVDIPAQNV